MRGHDSLSEGHAGRGPEPGVTVTAYAGVEGGGLGKVEDVNALVRHHQGAARAQQPTRNCHGGCIAAWLMMVVIETPRLQNGGSVVYTSVSHVTGMIVH